MATFIPFVLFIRFLRCAKLRLQVLLYLLLLTKFLWFLLLMLLFLRLTLMQPCARPFCKLFTARSKLARFLTKGFWTGLIGVLALKTLKSLLLLLSGKCLLLRRASILVLKWASWSSLTSSAKSAGSLWFRRQFLKVLRLSWHLALLMLLHWLLRSWSAVCTEALIHFYK